MVDTKISLLTAVTPPVVMTETTPVVQSGTTKKTTLTGLLTDPIQMSNPITTEAPLGPPAGTMLYTQSRGGVLRPAFTNQNNQSTAVQNLLATNKVGLWSAGGNSTTSHATANPGVTLVNFGNTTSGTLTARNVSTTNIFTASRRLGFAVGSTSNAGTRHGVAQFSRRYGFEYIVRFGIAAWNGSGSARLYAGLWSQVTAFTSDTLPIMEGFGLSATYNFGAPSTGTTVIVSGASGGFPATAIQTLSDDSTGIFSLMSANTELLDFRIYCPPNGTYIAWRLEKVSTGHAISSRSWSSMPGIDTLLSPQIAIAASTTSTGAAIDVVSQYIETDI